MDKPDELTLLLQAVKKWQGELSSKESDNALGFVVNDVCFAGYPARRAAELRVIEAARWIARDNAHHDCRCELCESVRALDAATPKGAADAE